MKKVLITGASGFIGSHLLKNALEDTLILAQSRTRKILPLSSNIRHITLDFLQPDWETVKTFAPDAIIHCAAMSQPEKCESQPDIVRQVNYTAAAQLADITAQIGAKLIFTSSDVVYDGSRGNYSEEDPPNPLHVYGRSKLEAENYILQHHPNAVVVRCALVYGKSLTGPPTFTETIVSHLREEKPITLFTDEYRTPILVDKLTAALWELVGNDYNGILHIGGSQKVSRYQMGQIICEALNLPEELLIPRETSEFQFSAPRAKDCSFNISRAKRVLKTELVSFAEGISLIFC